MKHNYLKKYHSFLKFRRDFARYSIQKVRSYEILLHWLKSHMNRNQFLILSGILVGTTAGLAGVLLKSLVHAIHHFITTRIHFEYQILFYLIFPFLGIVLTTAIVITFFKGQSRKGIAAILYEIARNSSNVPRVKMYSQILLSAVTVGLGGSAGLESPIAVTGSAIGSNFARRYQLSYKDRTLLLAAGATAGIAAAFNAPIAGIMFAFEILLTGVVFTDFIPLVVAAVCGSLVSKIILQEGALFQFHARESFNYINTPYYLVLGLLAALYARYFLFVSQKTEHFFSWMKLSMIKRALVGGVLLSILCVLLPPLFGEGYEAVKALTDGHMNTLVENSFFRYFPYEQVTVIIFLALVCLLKAFATPITLFGGGNGGNFAPSLFAGGTLGYLFAQLCILAGFEQVPETNLVLAGMAGVMSGVMYAPLTAIFLIAESSLGYDLFIPLMMVAVISYLIAKRFSAVSPELQKLAEEGKIFTTEHDKNLMSMLQVSELVDQQSVAIKVQASFTALKEQVKSTSKNIFAVVDDQAKLCGVITLDDIRSIMFATAQADVPVEQLMKPPPAVVRSGDEMVYVVRIFDETGVWQLPVVDADERFIGFISKSAVLARYREIMRDYSA
jgi:CIC family chloride channel protein